MACTVLIPARLASSRLPNKPLADIAGVPMVVRVAQRVQSGVPGAVRMLEQVHRKHGRLPWASLFQPAIALAEGGFKVSPRLHTLSPPNGARPVSRA